RRASRAREPGGARVRRSVRAGRRAARHRLAGARRLRGGEADSRGRARPRRAARRVDRLGTGRGQAPGARRRLRSAFDETGRYRRARSADRRCAGALTASAGRANWHTARGVSTLGTSLFSNGRVMKITSRLAVAAAALLLVAGAHAQDLVITNARIVDGAGGVIERGTVVV